MFVCRLLYSIFTSILTSSFYVAYIGNVY